MQLIYKNRKAHYSPPPLDAVYGVQGEALFMVRADLSTPNLEAGGNPNGTNPLSFNIVSSDESPVRVAGNNPEGTNELIMVITSGV